MYDGAKKEWLFRQTGIMVAVPELWGHIFVGRSKEGFSLNKVMIGYAGWGIERAPISDATLPILADGVKWLGYVPRARILWTLGRDRRRIVGGAVVLQLREPDLRPVRLGSGVVGERPDDGAPGRQ